MRDAVRIAVPTPTSADFEYNHRSWPLYAEALREAGGMAVEVNLQLPEREVMLLARGCDGVLLPGSPADVDPRSYGQSRVDACAPADGPREQADRLLLEEAYRAGKPVLGICYGAQSLNVWRGGSLIQDVACSPVNHSAGASVAVAHGVTVLGEGLLRQVVGKDEVTTVKEVVRLAVNSSHHQAIDRVGDGLQVVGVSNEDGVIEAIEGPYTPDSRLFVLGVQWHPERSTAISITSRGIFRSFVEAARVWSCADLLVPRP